MKKKNEQDRLSKAIKEIDKSFKKDRCYMFVNGKCVYCGQEFAEECNEHSGKG